MGPDGKPPHSRIVVVDPAGWLPRTIAQARYQSVCHPNRRERVRDTPTSVNYPLKVMTGAKADCHRGLVRARQQLEDAVQAELVADLECDRPAVQVDPVDGAGA